MLFTNWQRNHQLGFANRATRLVCTTAVLALIASNQAAAVDSEPLNNSQLTADSLPLLLAGTAVSNLAQLGGQSGDVDFFQAPLAAGEVLFGMVTPLAGLPDGFWSPDTIVSVFDGTAPRTFSDDDFASELPDFGGGLGSLFRFESPATAVYQVAVSGFGDYEFDGAATGDSHTESGSYVLTAGRVNPAIGGGGFLDTDPANQTAAGADLIGVTPGTARVAVLQLGESDVDFFRLDLKAGDVLSTMTAPLDDLGTSFDYPDTLLGLFDSSGTNLLVVNDDAGWEFDNHYPLASDFPYAGGIYGSALRALIPEDGTYYLAVTGFGDDDYAGTHAEFGAYALLVGVAVPEPGTASLGVMALAAGGMGFAMKRKRSRQPGKVMT